MDEGPDDPVAEAQAGGGQLMTKSVTEQVAQEKKRMALKLGKSSAKAEQWAQQVRDYDAKNKKK